MEDQQTEAQATTHLAINGGVKACNVEWPRWPVWGEAERLGLAGVLESGEWWYGRKVAEFEAAFAAFQNARFGITCSSGTTALEAALAALGVGAGDRVIVPPYTFVATASAVLRVGATPVFADIDPDTLNIDPAAVAGKIGPRTRAIIPVHVAGYIADMDRLSELAQRNGLAILEDACHAWGSQWQGKGAGALGNCGVFSFQASKNITSGEGGIILTDDEALAARCRSYTNCGRQAGEPWYRHFTLGSNIRLTEFQAALLLAQLSRLEEQTLRRAESAAILTAALDGVPGLALLRPEPRLTRRSHHFFAFRVNPQVLGCSRDAFIRALAAEGVPTSPGWPLPLYANPVFEGAQARPDYAPGSCPRCEQVCQEAVWIPQNVLLADAGALQAASAAVRKVCAHAAEAARSGAVS